MLKSLIITKLFAGVKNELLSTLKNELIRQLSNQNNLKKQFIDLNYLFSRVGLKHSFHVLFD